MEIQYVKIDVDYKSSYCRLAKSKYISVLSLPTLDYVSNMLFQYYDTPEYSNILFVINTEILDRSILSGYRKIIYYNLEHINLHKYDVNPGIERYWSSNGFGYQLIRCYDEIWDFLIENLDSYPIDLRDRVKFEPLRYVGEVEISCEYRVFDLLFVGALDTHLRHQLIDMLTNPTKYGIKDQKDYLSIAFLFGCTGPNLKDMVFKSKYVLDLPHFSLRYNSQNVVRIADSICMGASVISFLNLNKFVNYFENVIQVFDCSDNHFNYMELSQFVKNNEPWNCSELFKQLTANESDYENYKKSLIEQYNQKKINSRILTRN